MSFLKNLAKGFIRSGVNQVGRDGGRVISNQVYGDKHSIPIRNVGQAQSGALGQYSVNSPVSPNATTFLFAARDFRTS